MAFMGNGMQGGPQQPPSGGGNVQQMLAGLPPEVRAQVLARMGVPGGAPPPGGGMQGAPQGVPQPPPGAGGAPAPAIPDQGQNQMPGGAPAPEPRFEDLLFQNTEIPHEVKLQIMAARDAGNPQAMNEILFNSPMAHDLKLQLSQMAARPMPGAPAGGNMSNRPGHRGGQTERNRLARTPAPMPNSPLPQAPPADQAPGSGPIFGGGPSGREGSGEAGSSADPAKPGSMMGGRREVSRDTRSGDGNSVSNTRGRAERRGGGIGKVVDSGSKLSGANDEAESKPKKAGRPSMGGNYGSKLRRGR